MRQPRRARPSLEALEDRCCPSVSAAVVSGKLEISGSTSLLTVTEVNQGVFRVTDGQTVRGNFHVTGDIEIKLSTRDSDRVVLNLNGHSTPGNVSLYLGHDSPLVSIYGGTISGSLVVDGGSTHGEVSLGSPVSGPGPVIAPVALAAPDDPNLPPLPTVPMVGLPAPGPGLEVRGNTLIQMDSTAAGGLKVAAWVSLDGTLTARGVGQVNLGLGSGVRQDVSLVGGSGGMTAQIIGQVGGSVIDYAGARGDTLYVAGTSHVGGDVRTYLVSGVVFAVSSGVGGSALITEGSGGGSVYAAGTVGKDLVMLGGGGADSLLMQRTALVHGNVLASLGDGSNSATLRGRIDGSFYFIGGSGSDTVSLGGLVSGSALVILGNGTNAFALAGVGQVQGTLQVQGGSGRDNVGFSGQAVVGGALLVDLGDGNDSVAFGDGFRATTGVIDGGAGTDGFDNFAPAGVVLRNFEFGIA